MQRGARSDEDTSDRDARMGLTLEAATVFFVAFAAFSWRVLKDVGYWTPRSSSRRRRSSG